MASILADLARAAMPLADRVLSSVDSAAARTERLAATAIRYGVDASIVKARKPPTTTLSQIQPINVSAWDLAAVKHALDDHELGYFMQSVSMADAMGRDDRITACRNTRVRALAGKSGLGFSLTPSSKGASSVANDLAKQVTDLWWHSCPESALTRILEDAVMLGVGFARIHWERVDGQVVPRLEPWQAQTVWCDWSIRRYRAIGVEGQVIMDPGSAEWLIFEPSNYRSWMYGAIRGLGIPWLYRQFSRNDWSRYCEKHGLPIIAISEPAGHQWTTQKDRFYAGIRAIGRQGVVRLPKDAEGYGFDVKFVEPKDRSWQSFQEFIVRMDTDIAVMLLGQNLTTEVQGGSYAAAQAHEKVRLDYLDADAETLSTSLREQVWKPFVRFNMGSKFEESTPWPTWMTRPPADQQARIGIVKSYVEIGKAMADPDTQRVAAVDMVELATDLDITRAEIVDDENADDDDNHGVAAETKPQIFAYHFQYGLLTKNEGRALIGLDPVEGGEAVAVPAAEQGAPGAPPAAANAIVALKTNASEETKKVARHAVESLIRNGTLPRPEDVECVDCGHKGSDKQHSYDHRHGYTGENVAKVEAVCVDCHRLRDGQNKPVEASEDGKAKPRRKSKAKASATALSWIYNPPAPLPVRTYAGGRLRIRIDRPAGFVQRGMSRDGTPWERVYLVDYGYLDSTRGGDGDELDVFCGGDDAANTCFVIAQVNDAGEPDEFKLFLGFADAAAARACYEQHVPARYFGGISTLPIEVVVALRGEDPIARLAALSAFVNQPSFDTNMVLLSVERDVASYGPMHPETAATAYAALRSLTNVAPTALATWSASQRGRMATIAARTLHLLNTPPMAWDDSDVKAADKAAKTTLRLLTAMPTAQRNATLMALGCDVTAMPVDHDAVRANAIKHARKHSLHGARMLASVGGGVTTTYAIKPVTLSVNADELDAAYAAWRDAVNMTASELEAWAKTEESRLASVDPAAVIARNLRLLRKPKSAWDARDVADAKRTVSFVARMKKMPQGEPVRKGMPSKRDISLRNWAYDPSK